MASRSFTLRQYGPRSGTQGARYEFEVKHIDHNHQVIVNDQGQVVASFEVDKTTGHLNITGQNMLSMPQVPNSLSAAMGAALGNTAPPLASMPKVRAGKDKTSQNWRIENGVFYIRPTADSKDDQEVGLPIMDVPGMYTPSKADPILGQPEMLFTLCLAMVKDRHSLLMGPTGVGKTSAYRWLAKTLNYNLILMEMSRGTEAAHMVGEFMPDGKGGFEKVYGPVAEAVIVSQDHPTILVFEEITRIGNLAELARIYSLLDDTRTLSIKEFGDTFVPGDLFIGATANPADDEMADYIGVQELDPALASRFFFQPTIKYPDPHVEAAALVSRVPGLDVAMAAQMVEAARRVRESDQVRFPMSFRELMAWAEALPFLPYKEAAEIAVVSKSPAIYRKDLRNLLALQGN